MILDQDIIILVLKMPMAVTAGMMIQSLFQRLLKNVKVLVLETKMKFVVHPGGFRFMGQISQLLQNKQLIQSYQKRHL